MKIGESLLTAGMVLVSVLPAVAQRGRRASLEPQPLSVASGTPVEIRLGTEINTGEAKDGDTFAGTLMTPMALADGRRLERNTAVTGRVIKSVSSGRLKGAAELTLELTSVAGQSLRTEPVTLDGKGHGKRNAALIGGGTAAGAIIGAIAGGGKGAAIGAAVGAGAGTGTAYLTGKNELVLPVETALRFTALGAGGPTSAGGPTLAGGPTPMTPAPGSGVASGSRTGTVQSTGQPEARVRGPETSYERGQRTSQFPGADPQYTASGAERSAISNYLRSNARNLPPGLARRDRLPPGLERQVQRNGTLPPGLQRRLQPFPVDLTQQLAPLPAGVTRAFLGNRVVILDQAYHILDLFMVD